MREYSVQTAKLVAMDFLLAWLITLPAVSLTIVREVPMIVLLLFVQAFHASSSVVL